MEILIMLIVMVSALVAVWFNRVRGLVRLRDLEVHTETLAIPGSPQIHRRRAEFDNGRRVSIIQGYGTYSNGPDEWEVMAWPYSGDDVLGHLNERQVDDIMKRAQLDAS